MWQEAIDAEYFHKGKPFTRSDWDQRLGHCASVTDLPPTVFAEELIAAHPDAKVILTNRNVDAWHHSVMTTVIPALRNPFISAPSYFDNDSLGMWRPMIRNMYDEGANATEFYPGALREGAGDGAEGASVRFPGRGRLAAVV